MVTRGGNTRVAAGKTEHVDLRLAVPSVSAVSCGSRFARHGPVRPCEVRAVSPPRLSRTAETAWCDSALTRGRGEARGGRGRPSGPGKMAYKAGASVLYVGSAFLPRQSGDEPEVLHSVQRSVSVSGLALLAALSVPSCCGMRLWPPLSRSSLAREVRPRWPPGKVGTRSFLQCAALGRVRADGASEMHKITCARRDAHACITHTHARTHTHTQRTHTHTYIYITTTTHTHTNTCKK